MNRRHFLLSSLAGAAASAQKNQPILRPNILVIMADGLGSWMLGSYGNKEIQTPNIDNLARGGLRFTNAFSGAPVSSPSRATFFTGRFPSQHRMDTDESQGQSSAPESFASEILISDVLAKAGYNCGYVGKWNLGNDRRPGHGYGFSYTLLAAAATHMNPAMSLNGESVQESGYLAALMTQRACDFLDRQAPATPFFLTVGYVNPRPPYAGHPQKFEEMYASSTFDSLGWERTAPNAAGNKEMLGDIVGNLRRAAAAVSALDHQIPMLLRKLQERKLWDNTLIVFTSSNGSLLGRHGLWSDGLASDPANMYEEVVKVPFIVSWPGKIPTAEIAPELIGSYDVVPTLCEATGIAPPANRNLVGRSFLSVAKRDPLPKNQPWRNLVFAQLRNTWMARDARYKVVIRNEGNGPNELFDLASDPREKTNRYEDPQFSSVRQRLTRELEIWRKRAT